MEKLEEGTIVFNPKNYDNDVDKMWLDITFAVRMLTKQEYDCEIRQEDFGNVVITYCETTYLANEYGSPRFLIVTDEEQEDIWAKRLHIEENKENE